LWFNLHVFAFGGLTCEVNEHLIQGFLQRLGGLSRSPQTCTSSLLPRQPCGSPNPCHMACVLMEAGDPRFIGVQNLPIILVSVVPNQGSSLTWAHPLGCETDTLAMQCPVATPCPYPRPTANSNLHSLDSTSMFRQRTESQPSISPASFSTQSPSHSQSKPQAPHLDPGPHGYACTHRPPRARQRTLRLPLPH
jgi:hypothetical protein